MDQMQYTALAESLINQIRDLGFQFDQLSAPFRIDPATGKELGFDKFSVTDWRRNTFENALVRLRQLTENNFRYVETIGLLAVTRYIFELSIWLRLFEKDTRYCLVYYRELLMTQLKHHEDRLGQLRREIELLTRLQGLDHRVSDAEGSRHFSLYVDQAKINGYGFQAHLVESKEIPKVQETINQIQEEILEYKKKVPEDVQRLAEKDWRWRQMAKEAGLLHEHDYIYAYANRLLHAKPASLTTDHKNLEMHEICMFLRYIYVKMLEIMDLARSQPEYKIRPTS